MNNLKSALITLACGLLAACGGGGGGATPVPAGGGSSSSSSSSSGSSSSSSGGAAAVYSESFESLATNSNWRSLGATSIGGSCGVGGGKCVRVTYAPTATIGTTGSAVVQTAIPLASALEYSLNYDVYFEPGWEFVRGGKLPGFSSTPSDSGCSAMPDPAEWSVRLMWRTNGGVETYTYDQSRAPGACGISTPSGGSATRFSIGQWHAVTVYVRVNNPASSSNGEARMYLDGNLVTDTVRSNMALRSVDTANSRISSLMFSTFFGGTNTASTNWAPSQTVFARFDNLAVYPGLRVRPAPGQ